MKPHTIAVATWILLAAGSSLARPDSLQAQSPSPLLGGRGIATPSGTVQTPPASPLLGGRGIATVYENRRALPASPLLGGRGIVTVYENRRALPASPLLGGRGALAVPALMALETSESGSTLDLRSLPDSPTRDAVRLDESSPLLGGRGNLAPRENPPTSPASPLLGGRGGPASP